MACRSISRATASFRRLRSAACRPVSTGGQSLGILMGSRQRREKRTHPRLRREFVLEQRVPPVQLLLPLLLLLRQEPQLRVPVLISNNA